VLKAVTEGAGLVLIGLDDERVLKPEHKIADLPPFLADEGISDAYQVVAGRAIRLGPSCAVGSQQGAPCEPTNNPTGAPDRP